MKKCFCRLLLCGCFLSVCVFFCVQGLRAAGVRDTLSLAGQWRFAMDPQDAGVGEGWFNTSLAGHILLPGSMATNGLGDDVTLQTQWTGSIYDSSWFFSARMAKFRVPGHLFIPFWLTPVKHYVGPAWYQQDIEVPAGWRGKHVELYLERPHTETRVWVDGKEVGVQNSMVAPHVYVLAVVPGRHVLTIRIDNRIKDINVGPDSHSLTDHTQSNWNGVIGSIRLQAMAVVRVTDVQVYPDVAHKQARVFVIVRNDGAERMRGVLVLGAKAFLKGGVLKAGVQERVLLAPGVDSFVVVLPLGADAAEWDEFDPVVYHLTTGLLVGKRVLDEQGTCFGLRTFKAVGTLFSVNGRPVALRGTVNNCEFPLTGFPSMDVGAWMRIFRIARAHGLNHMRFHSWCPPEAAFVAADSVGFYLQPEGPSWANHGSSLGDGKPIDQFIYDETNRMAQVYGNHPSFCMLAYGNEPKGGHQADYLTRFIGYWKAKDSRRLYTGASVAMSWPLVPANEFMVKSAPRGLPWLRNRPESDSDYRRAIGAFGVPYVAHEMGQWCVYPNFEEIGKYTGAFRARNFELFREDLLDRGMGDEAGAFLRASGALQVLCYKAEIERALRTPGLGGFQLLSLNDYPGQGTALVGVLDAFWDEKGYCTAGEFARFCNTTVPLLRLPKFVFTNADTLRATAEVYHFTKGVLPQASSSWTIRDGHGVVRGSGHFGARDLPVGNGIVLGRIDFPLAGIGVATELTIEVRIDGTAFANDWRVWVYPALLPVGMGDVYYTRVLDDSAKAVLARGGKVFLDASGKVVKGQEVVQYFTPVFWNTSWFKMRPPHTLGILCDSASGAFGDFPTAGHSDYQWWEILNRSQVMVLEDFPTGFRPLVQPIDTWFLNRRLGLLLEARVGKGKLVVCSADLRGGGVERPAARQLFYSVVRYMNGAGFEPVGEVGLGVVQDLFETPSREVVEMHTKDSPDELKPVRKAIQ